MMKRHNNGISEEHIVAYLDGELNVNGEMREALGDAELRHVAKEYATLKKVFARTASEPRFLLSQSSDSRAYAYLQNVLRGKEGARMAPDAEAVRSQTSATVATKKFWAKRSVIGFAVVLFLGALWFTLSPNETPTVPEIVGNSTQPQLVQPSPSTVITPESVVKDASPTMPEVALNATRNVAAKRSTKKSESSGTTIVAAPVEEKPNIVANQQEEQPADIMISRRYAKLIKNVRIVEVTQQDKM
jgi:hypothetical protein